MRNSTDSDCKSSSTTNVNKYVTIATAPNKEPRVEKVMFDNRIKRKNVLALNEKVAAIREYEKRPIYKRIGRMFQCSPDQIKRIVQQKEAILNAWEQRTRKCRDSKTLEMKVVRVSMLGKAVYEWIRRMMYYKDILITDGLIQKMALQFKSAMGLQNFFPHQEWCDKFRATYKIYTCDSKTLNISYTQGHSVQIKDVMKDVLSECCPDDGEDENGTDENGITIDDDCRSIESIEDGEGKLQQNSNAKEKLKNKLLCKEGNKNTGLPTKTTASNVPTMHQLVALPIPGNGLAGGQKVLVATPIVTPGQKQGSGPMTMTIIPLATLGQHANNLNASSKPSTLNSNNSTIPQTSASRNEKNDDIAIPNPIVEIKKEIKEEPHDEEFVSEQKDANDTQKETEIKIKKEYISDEENDFPTPARQTTHPAMPTLLPAHVVAIPIHNKDMLEESSKDSLDDLTLSSLRKRIKTESKEQDMGTENVEKGKNDDNNKTFSTETIPAANMPPMPQLTKAPTLSSSPISPSGQNHSQAQSSSTTRYANRKRPVTIEQNSKSQELPAIRSCSEARKYLKLLEDFALERENFRLIGLIGRADEVLRELDRKQIPEDENEDVDID
ncbi:earthbound 1 [Haematobia irritans]|uniref:earthbound 1 n=1 Tax=Haematobia irritans TaxID=7368 RepID=UPI003F4F94A0